MGVFNDLTSWFTKPAKKVFREIERIPKNIWESDITPYIAAPLSRKTFQEIGRIPRNVQGWLTPEAEAPTPIAPLPMLADLTPPATSPASTTVAGTELGAATERARRRRARARSGSIFSRGLLFDEPSIYQPKLGGMLSRLGG